MGVGNDFCSGHNEGHPPDLGVLSMSLMLLPLTKKNKKIKVTLPPTSLESSLKRACQAPRELQPPSLITTLKGTSKEVLLATMGKKKKQKNSQRGALGRGVSLPFCHTWGYAGLQAAQPAGSKSKYLSQRPFLWSQGQEAAGAEHRVEPASLPLYLSAERVLSPGCWEEAEIGKVPPTQSGALSLGGQRRGGKSEQSEARNPSASRVRQAMDSGDEVDQNSEECKCHKPYQREPLQRLSPSQH